MAHPLVLPLTISTERALVGGKAAGLGRLIAGGFPVPGGICVTTESYRVHLSGLPIDPDAAWQAACSARDDGWRGTLASIRNEIERAACPDAVLADIERHLAACDQPADQLWAVRSSATNEDDAAASCAGLYRTVLGVPANRISASVRACWASLWEEPVVAYHRRLAERTSVPAMAVVIQPLIRARAAGVAHTLDPVTGQRDVVVVNAVPGLAQGLVDGTMMPDQFMVAWNERTGRAAVRDRVLVQKPVRLQAGPSGVETETVAEEEQGRAALADEDVVALAEMAKHVEAALGGPVDVEWAVDRQGLCLLQARPVTVAAPSVSPSGLQCEWSRTNFKETLPEVPSPLGLSFLEQFMELFLMGPYRRLGCAIPPGLAPVRVYRGRPYLNVSLMHALVEQMHGDPSILAEHMGGHTVASPLPVKSLGLWAMGRAGLLATWWMFKANHESARWFADLRSLAETNDSVAVQQLSLDHVKERLVAANRAFTEREMTFGIAGGVTQCLQVLGLLLPRWLGPEWRGLLNAALQGQAHVVSAEQILRLAALAEAVRDDVRVRSLFDAAAWDQVLADPSLEKSEFRRLFREYLKDYGQRGMGESDLLSPRFADQPELLLEVLRQQVHATGSIPPAAIMARQQAVREQALADIRARFGWRGHRWVVFLWWYRRLCRFFALREGNRHHLMYYAAAIRQLLLRAGQVLVEQGVLTRVDDVFFVRAEEQLDLLGLARRDWQAVVRTRRAAWEADARVSVPDHLIDGVMSTGHVPSREEKAGWRGIPISAGMATGPVRLVRTSADWARVRAGDILVAPVIDPGMAPLFGLAAGLVVEMGGTLSHGAIMAREYGLPTVANIPGLITELREGDLVEVHATIGQVRRVPAGEAGTGRAHSSGVYTRAE